LKKYVANCIGWIHIVRAVEVLAMGIRDLCNKIIPVVLEERVLKTLNGKVLSAESEYMLVEHRKTVVNGKKSHVEYHFQLDLKEEEEIATEE
jgi:hypothetical protein